MKHFRNLICAILLLFACVHGRAQKAGDAMPAFKILQTNNRYFQAGELDKTKPVVLIYFAPDCPHCQVLMDGIFKNISVFKNTQLVLITFKPLPELASFERQFSTAKYANIKTGTEGTTYLIRYYYNLSNTPFTAVYNKKGTLACSFRDINTPVSQIINCVKNLK